MRRLILPSVKTPFDGARASSVRSRTDKRRLPGATVLALAFAGLAVLDQCHRSSRRVRRETRKPHHRPVGCILATTRCRLICRTSSTACWPLDRFTRRCVAIVVASRLRSHDVFQCLVDLFVADSPPEHIRSDNGPCFAGLNTRRLYARFEPVMEFPVIRDPDKPAAHTFSPQRATATGA